MKKDNNKPIEIPSLILNNQVIETILAEGSTRFCVGSGDEFEIVSELKVGDVVYKPVRATSSLIKQGIVRLSEAPIAYGTKLELHSEIVSFIRKYLTLSPEFESTLATYLMLTWVYDAYGEVPYIRFQGDFGSGKTRGLIVSAALASKSFNAGGASTLSPIFHILDKYEGTLVLDEADFRVSDEKTEMVKILNNGNVRGFPVLRSMQNASKEYEPRAFSVYGPKVIAMRGSFDDLALESRFLTEEMNGIKRTDGVPTQVPKELFEEAAVLRRKLLSYRLRTRLSPRVLPKLPNLPDRQLQVIGSLISIAPSPEAQDAIVSVAKRSLERLSVERSWSFEAEVGRALAETRDAGLPLTVSEITKTLRRQLGRDGDTRLSPALVGRTLRNRLGVKLYKTRGVATVVPGQGENKT